MAGRLEDEIGVDLLFLNSIHITDFYFAEYQCSVIIHCILAGVSQVTLILRCVLRCKIFKATDFQVKPYSYYQIVIATYSFALPGHTNLLQVFVLLFWPTQSAPPPSGTGFVQVRVRVCEPTPQVLEQLLQDDH